MDYPLSRAALDELVVVGEIGSTNDGLRERVLSDEVSTPEFSALVSTAQTNGRGRLGRAWSAPSGTSLAASVLLIPGTRLGDEGIGWLPLLWGAAASRALRPLLEAPVAVKWPNDVLIDGLKVCGILAELLPDDRGVIVGFGVNLSIPAEELPTDRSTSLLVAGASSTDADAVLSRIATEARALYSALVDAGGDAERSGLRAAVVAECSTIGSPVSVELPGGEELRGTAIGLDGTGRLLVEVDGVMRTVSVGDITHLRHR